MRYTVFIDGEPGAFGVVFPDCPGCTAMGDTIEEALDNAGDALRDWMETWTEDGRDPPEPRSLDALAAQCAATPGAVLAQVALVRSTGRPVRANLSLDEGIVRALDAAAKRKGVTRSGMVEMLAREHLPGMG